jgi:predicted metal-dependent HD superfamily phosphohydrolase
MSSSASINSNELVKQQWVALCDRLNIKDDEEKIWSVIAARYSESARHYHTMNHIADLFEKKSSMNLKINDSIVFNLAIIFHDIVYDPASSTNEEDSVKLFQELCTEHIPKEIADKTSEYIIATKR